MLAQLRTSLKLLSQNCNINVIFDTNLHESSFRKWKSMLVAFATENKKSFYIIKTYSYNSQFLIMHKNVDILIFFVQNIARVYLLVLNFKILIYQHIINVEIIE